MKLSPLLLGLLLSPLVLAGPQDDGDSDRALASQKRMVAAYGFEEAGEFPTRLPAPFFRLLTRESGRPGFPQFGSVEVDDQNASEGTWSLRFDVDGGSMAVAIPPAEIPIFPQSHYQVRVKACTRGLVNAGASIAVRLHDIEGREIAGTARFSPVVQTNGKWTTLTVEPPMDVPEASDLVIELRLDQPGPSVNEPGVSRDLSRNDIEGTAWFDDIEVWQLPRMIFSAIPRTGATKYPDQPLVRATLRDLAQGSVSARLLIEDIDGVLLQERILDLERGKSELSMELEVTSPGWYLGELVVRDGEDTIALSRQGLAILPERAPAGLAHGAPYFGISFDEPSSLEGSSDQALMQLIRPDYVVVPIWKSGLAGTLDAAKADRFDQMLDAMARHRIEPVFSLAGIPSDASDTDHLDPHQVLQYIDSSGNDWYDMLEPWVAQYGDEVSRWRIRCDETLRGEYEDSSGLHRLADMTDELVAAPSIELAFPMASMEGRDAGMPDWADDRVLEIPVVGDVNPGGFTAGEQARSGLALRFSTGSSGFSPREHAEKLGRQLVEAWSAGATFIEMDAPWRSGGQVVDDFAGMEPTGVAFNRVASFLSGRPPVAEVPLGRGVRAVLAGGRGAPLMVAWAMDADVMIDFKLADGSVYIHDVLGGTREIRSAGGSHAIHVGQAPVIIEGIDQSMARFRSMARITPGIIEASTGLHDLDLQLFNPWKETIDVRVRPVGPASFRFQPRTRTISIDPGESVDCPFEFSYPRTQVDGPIDLKFEASIQNPESHEVRLLVPTDIQSPTIDMEATWKTTYDSSNRPSGVLVTVRARNKGSSPILLEAFSSAVGHAPMRKALPEIPPGGTAARTFAYSSREGMLHGHEILVGVNQIEGSGRVVRRLLIQPEPGSLVEVDLPEEH